MKKVRIELKVTLKYQVGDDHHLAVVHRRPVLGDHSAGK